MLQEIAHTADIGIQVSERKLTTVFETAGLWLVKKLVSIPNGLELRKKAKTIILREDNQEELLIRFLNEIIYLYSGEGLVFMDFEIIIEKERRLEAKGYTLNIFRNKDVIIQTEIKAATYHQLELKPENDIWKATVFFDV